MKINMKYLPVKAHYFLFNAGIGSVLFYMPTLIKQLGFSAVVIGTIYSILWPSMFARPLFGIIADKFKIQKPLFCIFLVITGMALFSPIFVPPIVREASVDYHCNANGSRFEHCSSVLEDNEFDPCVIDRITNWESTDEMKCETNCWIPSEKWSEVCRELQLDCGTQQNQLNFNAFVPKNQLEEANQCLRLPFGRVEGLNSKCVSSLDLNCRTICDEAEIMDVISEDITMGEAKNLYQFWLIWAMLMSSSIGMSVSVSFGDAICFQMLGDNPELYGYQRLWGAVGWGTISLLAGYLVDTISQGQYEKDYSVAFYMALAFMSLDVLVSTQFKHTQNKGTNTLFRDFGSIFLKGKMIIFLLWCISVGVFTGLIWSFLFWHLEELAESQEGCDSMDWMKTLQGLVMAIQCLGGELPFFWCSGWIIKKLGHINSMTLVLAAFGSRFVLYSLLTNPWWTLPIEFINGITFGLFWPVMTSYANSVAPLGAEATVQGFFGVIYEGVGASIGALVSGIMVSQIGSAHTFRYFGIFAFALAFLHFVVQLLMNNGVAEDEKAEKRKSIESELRKESYKI